MDQNDHGTENEPDLPGLRLSGKVAIITGGARGIGAATAKLFSRQGAYVVIADILDELGTTLANAIGGQYTHCDVSNESDIESAVQLALTWKGQLNIMVNNAGIAGPDFSILSIQMDKIKPLFGININGTLHGIKHAARAMISSKKGGSIVCMASTATLMGGMASHAYTLSKEAILGVMRSSACELGAHGIRVNCVSPHGVPSDMLVTAYRRILKRPNLTSQEAADIVGSGCLMGGRAPSMDDVAQAVLYLASDESGFVTAHNLVVDGGYTSASSKMSFIYQDSIWE